MVSAVLQNDHLASISNEFEDAHPQDILHWATATYGRKLSLVTSFQATGIVTLHMLRELGANVTVMTLDTGLHFPETYDLIDRIEDYFGIYVKRIRPQQTLRQQAEQYGDDLWRHDPDQCCHVRKVAPLGEALRGFDAWLTGLRRDQSARRANTPIVSYDSRKGCTKICPLATWTEDMIWTYIDAYDLPYNDLHDYGFPSIGCHTCTRAVKSGDDMRAGRWSSHSKTECGIHLPQNVQNG